MQRQISHAVFVTILCFMLEGCGKEASVYGLKPDYPIARHNYMDDGIAFVTVDSLQPTLRWESFPRSQDDVLVERVKYVTYDLQVWKTGESDQGAELVYERTALPTPFHTIDRPLSPSAKYLWSVRARFDLEGKPRLTEWGRPSGRYVFRRLNVIPNLYIYRFETPAE